MSGSTVTVGVVLLSEVRMFDAMLTRPDLGLWEWVLVAGCMFVFACVMYGEFFPDDEEF